MKKNLLLTLLSAVLSFATFAQVYDPTQHTVSNKSYGMANAGPTDARSYFYDADNFKYRQYVSTAEVLSYLSLPKYRTGQFDIIVNTGGSLSAGVITGGVNTVWYFKDGTVDSNLVLKGFSGAISWGSLEGTLSDQADLQSALDAKQATLVSGTSIKTINNTSVLGSGNIDVTVTTDATPTNGSTNPVQSDGVFDALALKQAADADLTIYAGITPTTVAQSLLAFANPSAVRYLRVESDNSVSGRTTAQVLSDIGAQAADADLSTYAGITPTTVAQNLLAFANPSAIRFFRVNADNSVSGRTAAELLSDISAAASNHTHGAADISAGVFGSGDYRFDGLLGFGMTPASGNGYIQLDTGTTDDNGIRFGETTLYREDDKWLTTNATILKLGASPTIFPTSGALTLQSSSDVNLNVGNARFANINNTLGILTWANQSRIYNDGDGSLSLRDNAGTAFTQLALGGTSSSYPAIRRSSAALHFKLADNSGFADIQAAGATFSSLTLGSVSNTEFGYLDGVTSAIQTQINGKQVAIDNTVDVSANTITVDDFTTTTPSAPSDGVTLFSRERAGRNMLAGISPSGKAYSYQPSLFSTKVGLLQSRGGSVATIDNWGINATANTAASAATTTFNGNLFVSIRRTTLPTTSSAGTVGGVRNNSLQWHIGDAAGKGGFFLSVIGGQSVFSSDARGIVGMWGTSTAMTNADPSSLTNYVGFGYDATDTNWKFMHNDGSGSCTVIDLGANFPCKTTAVDMYEFRIYCPPNGGSISYSIYRVNTGNLAEGTVSTNIPANTQGLSFQVAHTNNATASITGFDLSSLYIESDY